MSENSPTGDKTPPLPTSANAIIMAPIMVPYELRNAEAVHDQMLRDSKNYSDNLRKGAEQFLTNYLLEEQLKAIKLETEAAEEKAKLQEDIILEQKRIQDAEARVLNAQRELRESERKRREAEVKAREAEVKAREAENAVKRMPAVPPRVATPPPATSTTTSANTTQTPVAKSPAEAATSQPAQPPHNPFAQVKPPTTQSSVESAATPPASAPNPSAPAASSTPAPPQSALQHVPIPSQPSAGTANQPATSFSDMVDGPETQKYISVHLQLKMLRKQVKPKGKANTSPLKDVAMKQGADIRVALGQLSIGNKNANVFNKLRDIMKDSLTYQVNIGQGAQVPMIDPSPYVLRVPAPVTDGTAKNNGDQLPVLFIYLLSIFSKALIAQAAQEAALKSESAEPIAMAAHQIFSHPDLLWRGMSMIDILIAKLRKSCGALFGFRGAETKDTGRITLGWKKEDGMWVSESIHYDRMRGIGAFYAGLTLRRYKNRVNPYPPPHYWRAMAAILTCPQQERSNTSYYVLGALIKGYEGKFQEFYGDFARLALEAALIHYPMGAREKNVAVMTLLTLGDKAKTDGFIPQA
ncbi:GLE1-domain-containing protein [Mollisia scopiformis]|uniref:mRNA export factor GLE1 n=1 Tax=Mollisia scopiformis TaxID=149040 RepID=A0A194XHL3_MOLSC|nr:GLE1-domain-containing protein [Mollisia scopiformis]KUJ19648.1 GLE1-domain-containing protein [Mollisia scopiformis]